MGKRCAVMLHMYQCGTQNEARYVATSTLRLMRVKYRGSGEEINDQGSTKAPVSHRKWTYADIRDSGFDGLSQFDTSAKFYASNVAR